MDHRIKKQKVWNFFTYLIVAILGYVSSVLINGIPLRGVPEWEEIDKIEISSEEFEVQSKVISGIYETNVAQGLFKNTKCSILSEEDVDLTNAITVKFYVDGEEYIGIINEKSVVWQGKSYKLKEEPEYLGIAKAFYFSMDNE